MFSKEETELCRQSWCATSDSLKTRKRKLSEVGDSPAVDSPSASKRQRKRWEAISVESPLTCVEFHPSELVFASGAHNGNVDVWRAQRGEFSVKKEWTIGENTDDASDDELAEMTEAEFAAFLRAKQCQLSSACVSVGFNATNGSTLYSGWSDGSVRLSDCTKQKMVTQWNHFDDAHSESESQNEFLQTDESSKKLRCVMQLENGGQTLVTADGSGYLRLWDWRTAAMSAELKEREGVTRSGVICMTSARRRVLVSNDSGQLSVYDLRKQQLCAKSDELRTEIVSMQLCKFDTRLVTGTVDGRILVWKWGDFGSFNDVVKGHSANVRLRKYDEDSLLTVCDDGTVRLICIYPHRLLHVVGSHSLRPIDCVALSADRSMVVSYSQTDAVLRKLRHTHLRTSPRRLQQLTDAGIGALRFWDLCWTPRSLQTEMLERIAHRRLRNRSKNVKRLSKAETDFLDYASDDTAQYKKVESVGHLATRKKIKLRRTYVSRKDDPEWSEGEEEEDVEEEEEDKDGVGEDEAVESGVVGDELEVDGEGDIWEGLAPTQIERRIKYKTFEDRKDWLKVVGKRKKIRKVTAKHNAKHAAQKFFRGMK